MNVGIVVLAVALFPIGVFTKEPTLWARLQDMFQEKPAVSSVALQPVSEEQLRTTELPPAKVIRREKEGVASRSDSSVEKQPVDSSADEYAATENDKTVISLVSRWIMKDYPEVEKVNNLLNGDIQIFDHESLNEMWRPRVVHSLDDAIPRLQRAVKNMPYFSVCVFPTEAYIIPFGMECFNLRKEKKSGE